MTKFSRLKKSEFDESGQFFDHLDENGLKVVNLSDSGITPSALAMTLKWSGGNFDFGVGYIVYNGFKYLITQEEAGQLTELLRG